MGLIKLNKRTLSLIMIIIGLPLAIATVSGGGIISMIFTAILAIGVDLLSDTIAERKQKRLYPNKV